MRLVMKLKRQSSGECERDFGNRDATTGLMNYWIDDNDYYNN